MWFTLRECGDALRYQSRRADGIDDIPTEMPGERTVLDRLCSSGHSALTERLTHTRIDIRVAPAHIGHAPIPLEDINALFCKSA